VDNLQEQFGVTFVIAAGNYDTVPLLSYPRRNAEAHRGRITSPADSVLGVTVASISQLDHPSTGGKRGEPSCFFTSWPWAELHYQTGLGAILEDRLQPMQSTRSV
jgi:hypothetical protein